MLAAYFLVRLMSAFFRKTLNNACPFYGFVFHVVNADLGYLRKSGGFKK